MTDGAWLLAQQGGWAALATLGFAVSFNVPRYALLPCAVIGALAYAARAALLAGGAGIVLATFLGALAIGVSAAVLARYHGVSEVLFAAGPGIPLVPGSLACGAVMSLVIAAGSNDPVRGAEALQVATDSGLKATLAILFLSLGIALPSLVWSAVGRRR